MRLRWLIVIALLLALGLVAYWLLSIPRVTAERAVAEPLEQRVVATGRVASPERIEVGSVLVATVAQVLVEEGAVVSAKQPLVRLVNAEIEAAVRSAEANLQLAQANLGQLEQVRRPLAAESQIQAELQLRQARRDYKRAAELAQERFVSEADVEARKETLDLAVSRLRSAKQSLAAVQPEGSEYRAVAASLEQAQATLAQAKARYADTLIQSPTAATIISRLVDPGDVVQPGAPMLVLASAGRTLIEAQLDERNLGLVEVGQPAVAAADAYPQQHFPAKVSFIAPAVDAQRGTVEIKLNVPEPPAYLRTDMTVTVDILVGQREQALTVSRSAVQQGQGANPWLLVVRDEQVVRQNVALGLIGDERVEVLDGIVAGEWVLSDPAAAAPGERVRVQEAGN